MNPLPSTKTSIEWRVCQQAVSSSSSSHHRLLDLRCRLGQAGGGSQIEVTDTTTTCCCCCDHHIILYAHTPQVKEALNSRPVDASGL